MANFPFLSVIIILPLLGALFIVCMGDGKGNETTSWDRNARFVALWTAVITWVLTLVLWKQFDISHGAYQFVESYTWLPVIKSRFTLGVDGISLPFVLLTGLLTPLCILASWNAITHHVRGYVALFLVLETFVMGTFLALDFVIFYLFFEGVLIPMYFIIGLWGGERRVYAAFKFFLYTLAGSVVMLVAITAIIMEVGTADFTTITGATFNHQWQTWLWLAFFVSFAVKMPMWPVHTWLPDAHVEAPTAGSVMLAGVLLKMGGYGFVRFLLPMFPEASVSFAPLVYTLSLIAVVYTSLVALVQEDIKKLIAYSSIAHMAFVTYGVFTLNPHGVHGAVTQMISHGLISSALFLSVGVLYDRMHTRQISAYGGLAKNMPLYAVLMMIFSLGAIALPGTSGFVAEFMVLLGSIQVSGWMTTGMALSMVLGAAYMLYVYRRILFGKIVRPELAALQDLSLREKLVLCPLAILIIWIGIYPSPLLRISEKSIEKILDNASFRTFHKNTVDAHEKQNTGETALTGRTVP